MMRAIATVFAYVWILGAIVSLCLLGTWCGFELNQMSPPWWIIPTAVFCGVGSVTGFVIAGCIMWLGETKKAGSE